MSSWRISHLGINPVSGGRPPKDRSTSGVRAVRAGVLAHEVARELMLVALLILKIIKAEKIIVM